VSSFDVILGQSEKEGESTMMMMMMMGKNYSDL
jgi:hypothetical protein